jgi:hypothetical protein
MANPPGPPVIRNEEAGVSGAPSAYDTAQQIAVTDAAGPSITGSGLDGLAGCDHPGVIFSDIYTLVCLLSCLTVWPGGEGAEGR